MFLISASTVWNGTVTRCSKFFDTNLRFCNLLIYRILRWCGRPMWVCWRPLSECFFWWDATPILFRLSRHPGGASNAKKKGNALCPAAGDAEYVRGCFLRIWINVPYKYFYAVFLGELNFSRMPVINYSEFMLIFFWKDQDFTSWF